MNKIFLTIALIFFITSCSTSKNVVVKTLYQTSTSWDGNDISYPKNGKEEITLVSFIIPPKTKLPFHCHPVPILGYVISGQIEVEKMDGEKKLFNAGDALIEVVNTWHRGYNPSSIKDVKIAGFYIGQKSVSNSIAYKRPLHNNPKSHTIPPDLIF